MMRLLSEYRNRAWNRYSRPYIPSDTHVEMDAKKVAGCLLKARSSEYDRNKTCGRSLKKY